MKNINSQVLSKVLTSVDSYDYNSYTANDVKQVLKKQNITIDDFKVLLSPAAMEFLEQMAKRAKADTKRYFGNNIKLFTPLYISNYCDNHCIYCGFNCTNKIKRAKLSYEEIEIQMKNISKSNLEEILILTGESAFKSNLKYIGEACRIATKYFKVVGIEVYALDLEDYEYLHGCGVDYVTIFQETYDKEKYKNVHLKGLKTDFDYRFNTQERALMAKMRGVTFGALLGLADFRKDAYATGLHISHIHKKFPTAELSVACPRLCLTETSNTIGKEGISERELLQVILAYRLALPFITIVISSREQPKFRDNVIGLVANKISAGVSTSVGDNGSENHGSSQFIISDGRSVDEIVKMIKSKKLQPVYCDYIRL
ncbi:MAG: 2-iminoacetate synthase ThiH [Bacilli bacterium]